MVVMVRMMMMMDEGRSGRGVGMAKPILGGTRFESPQPTAAINLTGTTGNSFVRALWWRESGLHKSGLVAFVQFLCKASLLLLHT